MFLCGILCISLSQISDVYQSRMKYVGAVYLLWLAWHIFISKPDAKSEVMSKKPSFMSGFIVQFVNVKVMLYGMVSITSFVFPYTNQNLLFFICYWNVNPWSISCINLGICRKYISKIS